MARLGGVPAATATASMILIRFATLWFAVAVGFAALGLLRAHQAKAKSSLGTLRTTISLYYSDTEGHYPLESYPTGTSHYTTDGLSLSAVLVPRWMDYVPIPILKDQQNTFNGITGDWDVQVRMLMTKNPIDDVYILPGPADYTPLLVSPYAFDNQKGVVYIPNGNYDLGGHYFYDW
jgi:hypothetical protein